MGSWLCLRSVFDNLATRCYYCKIMRIPFLPASGEQALAGPDCNPYQLGQYTSPEFRAAVAGITDPAERQALLGDLTSLHDISLASRPTEVTPEFAQGFTALTERLGLSLTDRSVGTLARVSRDSWDGRYDDRAAQKIVGLGETLAAFFADPTRFSEQDVTVSDAPRREPLDDTEYRKLGLLLRLV